MQTPHTLSKTQLEQFVQDGFIRLEHAFPKTTAEEGCRILWQDIAADPNDPSTWKQPVVRLGEYAHEPFRQAANTPLLHTAFDQLIGKGRWLPRNSLGTFPVRFPSKDDSGDAGWHVDASFPGENPSDYLSWRVNVKSRGRALLILFLFSDVSEQDAPTRIRVGSHLNVAKLLEPYGEEGLTFMELAQKQEATDKCPQVLATGEAGTVYLCHPFLVHAAQAHQGTSPRFMAQPPLLPAEDFQLDRKDENYAPVEMAIRMGLGWEK
ncbi:phytanoyl-CoA dioxygenase family protein [Catalinimonas niigatensis]|uniref:phytanoyl-CoA dioxygenase family protein n=1 Tax=Catalinimonas niigatensis TaxID=1397264 RepID=UPI0026650CA7|nr:phytanoyl-CoA dioxygenase family protein [Catalinimonas niigatensis]WPP52667.1 phytanoyl-CoA dioxygenase family protein [Catalinimonas niigatensis]